jgi:ABC-type branched-subunit amino acid transport system permease subunit
MDSQQNSNLATTKLRQAIAGLAGAFFAWQLTTIYPSSQSFLI